MTRAYNGCNVQKQDCFLHLLVSLVRVKVTIVANFYHPMKHSFDIIMVVVHTQLYYSVPFKISVVLLIADLSHCAATKLCKHLLFF